MTDRQPRKRLYSHVTRTRFLHLEDALNIAKIRLFAGEYRKGSGASATAHHFLDLDDARVLLADLSWGKKVEFTDYKGTSSLGRSTKGTSNRDGPQSRVLKVKANGDKVWLEIQNGPGEIVGQGAVKPKGKPTAAVSVPLTVWEARKLAHAALAYIRAWESEYLLDVAPTGPVDGDRSSNWPTNSSPRSGDTQFPGPARSPAPPVTTPAPVVTKPADQVAATVTTNEIEETTTGYWTFYNTTAKPAGVAYTHALNIANKHGEDWKTAIAKLRQAVAEA